MPDGSRLEIVTEVPDRAMVIFAHPDDAEIASGGVIATRPTVSRVAGSIETSSRATTSGPTLTTAS